MIDLSTLTKEERARELSQGLILLYLFRDGALGCLEAADANDDGSIDVSDAVRVLLYLYAGRGPLPAPFPAADADPTPDGLGCTKSL